MQDFDSESLSTGIDIPKTVKAISVESDYGLKDCVNLPSLTAEFRLNEFPSFSQSNLTHVYGFAKMRAKSTKRSQQIVEEPHREWL